MDVLRKKDDREKLVDIFCRKTKRRIPSTLKDFIVQSTDDWAPANILNILREMYDPAGTAEPTRNDFAQVRTAEFVGEETCS